MAVDVSAYIAAATVEVLGSEWGDPPLRRVTFAAADTTIDVHATDDATAISAAGATLSRLLTMTGQS